MERMTTFDGGSKAFLENGKKSIEGLETQNIVSFDLKFSVQEKEILKTIKVENNSNFDIYDLGEGQLVESLVSKLEGMGNNDPEVILGLANIIAARAQGFKEMMSQEALSVTVRFSLPHPYNDVPRWHNDGTYFTQADDEKVYKMVFPVIGANTLFGEVSDKDKYDSLLEESYRNDQMNLDNPDIWNAEDLRIRNELDTVVQKCPDVGEEKTSVFLVGHEEAVIHSEPAVSAPRIFVTVLGGSKAQIEEMIAVQ
jgi:hypothetical protein